MSAQLSALEDQSATPAHPRPLPPPRDRRLPPADAPIRGDLPDERGDAGSPLGGWLVLTLKIVCGAVGIGVALALAMVGLVLVASPAQARTGPASSVGTDGGHAVHVRPAAAVAGEATPPFGDGAVLLLDRCGTAVAAPLLSSEARITITGPVVRAKLIQRFLNEFADADADADAGAGAGAGPDASGDTDASMDIDAGLDPGAASVADDGADLDPETGIAAAAADGPDPACQPAFIEATYLFPMADGAAVDHLRLVIGERVIEGRIQEKQAAVRAHEQARAEGRRTALLEARRPNAFSTRVANIAPGETVTIEIEYQQILAPTDGVSQLRFPGVVAPRYSRDPDGGDLAQPYVIGAGDDPVDVILDESFDEWLHARRAEPDFGQFMLTVTLDPGVPIIAPRSPSHRIQATAPDAAGSPAWQVVLDEAGPADRDFVLEWQPRDSTLPHAGLRVETHDGETYGLLIVAPPRGTDTDRVRLPRETTFVVDTSGSMGGQSIEQARNALLFALDRLMPGDAFNLIEFNSRHRALFRMPVAVDDRSLAMARRWVRGLTAQGGTEMRGAVTSALAQPASAGRLGQVIFITDGAVDYEEELVSQIGELLGERRLFTVAIGSAPNSWFLRKAAEIGGGTLTQIGTLGEVERRMATLFTRLSNPVSTDLALEIEGATLLQPARLPRDLYAGEPLVTVLRLSAEPTLVKLKGRHETPWERKVDIADADAAGAGLPGLWARGEIEAIDDQLQREAPTSETAATLRAQATRLAIDHRLVSRYTSLVAIDTRVARAPTDALLAVDAPAAWPAGWTLPQTATPAGLQLLLGCLLLIAGFGLLIQRRVCAWLATLFGAGR